MRLSKKELAFLKALPADGSALQIEGGLLDLAFGLYATSRADGAKFVFLTSGSWPTMYASITFAGRKALSRLP